MTDHSKEVPHAHQHHRRPDDPGLPRGPVGGGAREVELVAPVVTERRVDTETRPPASGPDSELWHICEAHPYADDAASCGPECRSYCGRDYESALSGGIVVSPDGPDDCVVCSDLFQGDPRT